MERSILRITEEPMAGWSMDGLAVQNRKHASTKVLNKCFPVLKNNVADFGGF
jgi:hypothetical protein